MTQPERLDYLVRGLAGERAHVEIPKGDAEKRRLLRALMNVRPPAPISPDWLRVQDLFLQAEARERGIVDAQALPAIPKDPRLALWRGDITRLRADAVVNAANSALLGCFFPCHGCIDNAIHSSAGLQLRAECHDLMERQGHEEPPGGAKLTGGYNLPASHVLHTVGPMVSGALTERHCALLASCYRSCLELAERRGLSCVAFCCISTGEFRFPPDRAAEIAVSTVEEYLSTSKSAFKVIFNVYQASDELLYRRLLGAG